MGSVLCRLSCTATRLSKMFAAPVDRADVSADTVGAFGAAGGFADAGSAVGAGKGFGASHFCRRPHGFDLSRR
jgi:hypothetical protein